MGSTSCAPGSQLLTRSREYFSAQKTNPKKKPRQNLKRTAVCQIMEQPLSPSLAYWTTYAPLMMALRGGVKLLAPHWRVCGRENIPARGGVLFAPNHISDVDPLLVGLSLRRPAWFMAKHEL